VWNHSFYWNCLSPKGGAKPTGDIADAIGTEWGSFRKFKDRFTQAATTNFGSGWTWLVENQVGRLEIVNTSNAENPLIDSLKPILTIDVWEHAYYIDYRNARPDYVSAFWNVVNWDFANENLE
jgi:Fe-Mn family superoxide dismutase